MSTINPQLQRFVLAFVTPFIELLAPPRCGICDREGALLCGECRAAWIRERPEVVPGGSLRAAAALGPYEGGLGAAIRTVKYGGVQALASELGAALHPAIQHVARSAPFQVTLVPIPTDATRVHERGFDHALLLAEAAGTASGVSVAQLLARTRPTAPLHGASRAERTAILHGAMAVIPGAALPPAVVLVDDIQTSGATMHEAARVLSEAGVGWIAGVSVAYER